MTVCKYVERRWVADENTSSVQLIPPQAQSSCQLPLHRLQRLHVAAPLKPQLRRLVRLAAICCAADRDDLCLVRKGGSAEQPALVH